MITDLTLFSCEQEEHAAALSDFLRNWARAGLLHGDLWAIEPRQGDEPWQATPLLLADTEHQAVGPTLTSALAARPYETVRVVKVFAVGDAASSGSADRELVALRDEIRRRLPGGRADVHLVNLVVPLGPEVHGVPGDALSNAADLNVIAVPEDQKGSGFASEPFPDQESYLGWGATLAVTLAGAWAGVPRGPLDDRQRIAAMGRPVAVTARAFLRLIDGGFLVDHIGAGLVGRFDEWPVPAGVEGGADLIGRRPDALSDLAREFVQRVDDGALCFKRVPPKERPPKTALKWWMAFALMFRYIANALRNAPTNFLRGKYDQVRDRAAAWVTRVTVGTDSRYVVTFAGRGGDAGSDAVARTIEDLRSAADRITGQLGLRNAPPAAPEAWRALRQAMFSLADGGSLPRPLSEDPLMDGSRRLLVRSPLQLAPDPEGAPLVLYQGLYAQGEPLAPWAGRPSHPCDPLGCMEMDRALVAAIHGLEEEPRRFDPVISAPRPAAPPSPSSGERTPFSNTTGPEAEDSSASPDAVDGEGRDQLDPVERRARLYAQTRLAIREWVVGRRNSFAWRVGEHLADQIGSAIDEYIRAMAVVAQGRPEGMKRDAKRARRRLNLRWFLLTLVVVLAVVGGWQFLALSLPLLMLAAIPVQFVGMFVAFVFFQREMFRLQYRAHTAQLDYDHAEESVVQSSAEIVKLLDRYEEYLDWTLTLSKFVHRPWGDPPETVLAGDEVSLEHVPRAVVSAKGYIAEADVRGLRARALREVIRKSWLSSLFSPIRDSVLRDLAREQGVEPDEITPPEADRSTERSNSRRMLRDHLLKGTYSDAARQEFERAVTGFCRDLVPAKVFEYAEIDLREGDEVPVAELPGTVQAKDAVHLEPVQGSWAAGAIDVPTVARAALDTVVHLHVRTADGGGSGSGVVLRPDGRILTNAHVVESAEQIVVEFADGSSAEADLLAARPEQDLAVVQARCPTPAVARVRDGGTAVIGESVVAIGNPLGQRGGPSVSVGIVSATGREGQFESAYLTDMIQTDAAISPGSSGGGLFDGGAQLIGITTGGAARGENIGFAIPIRRAFEVLGSSLGGETLPAAVPDEAASGDRVPNGQSPERRRAPRYHDIDRFFAEIEPDAGHIEMFGTGLWSTAKNLAGEGSTLHESQLWHPAGAAFDWSGKQWPNGTTVTTTVIAPPVALGRRLIYAAVRLDFSSAGVESDFTLFDPARTKEG